MPPKNEEDFLQAIAPLRGAIRLHCYRMLGSAHDGDDVVQETMLRAWRAQDSLQDPALVKPWLYRIATNVCFDELKQRPKRLLAIDAIPPGDEPRPPFTRLEEPVWLEPMPDSWLDGVDQRDPQARYALKESVALAFVAALQCLSPAQRASLLLRDVIGLSANETASALGTSVEARFAGSEAADIAAHNEVDEAVLARYVRAFEDADLDALVALFHEEMRTTMPPIPTWVSGGAANERFYRAMFGQMAPGYFRTISTRANGLPALAFYRPASPGAAVHILVAIELLTTRDGAVSAVDHFMLPEIFPLFEVPRELRSS